MVTVLRVPETFPWVYHPRVFELPNIALRIGLPNEYNAVRSLLTSRDGAPFTALQAGMCFIKTKHKHQGPRCTPITVHDIAIIGVNFPLIVTQAGYGSGMLPFPQGLCA